MTFGTVYFGCVRSKILWVKLKFARVKMCFAKAYASIYEDNEQKEKFRSDLIGLWVDYEICINLV